MKKITKLLLIISLVALSTFPVSAKTPKMAVYQGLLKRYCKNFSGVLIIEVYSDIEVYGGTNLGQKYVIPDNFVIHMDCYDIYYENGVWIN